MHDKNFCFRRLTVTDCVSRLILKDVENLLGFLVYTLVFHITIEREHRPDKVLCASGQFITEQQVLFARRVQQGCVVKAIGCVKENGGFDLEQLLEVRS